MLISCPGCSNKVSSNAPTCPQCGCQLKATLVEQTSKRWKRLQMIAVLPIIVGAIAIMFAAEPDDYLSYIGVVVFAVGTLTLIGSSICAWWYHG